MRGIELDGLGEVGDGTVIVPRADIGTAPAVIGLRVVGIDFKGRVVVGDGAVVVPFGR